MRGVVERPRRPAARRSRRPIGSTSAATCSDSCPTPHVPHNWESALWFDEVTETLFGGDLFTALGDGPAIVETDLVDAALIAEEVFHSTSISPTVPSTMRTLAELDPGTIACMHGPSFHGDGAAQLLALADAYDALI